MNDDDRCQHARPALSRRAALGALGKIGAASILGSMPAPAAASASVESLSCIVTPEETAGPFYIDEHLNRSDLTSGTSRTSVLHATPLRLHIAVYKATRSTCTALTGAVVDVWHADALGAYSDVRSEGTLGQTFLRGYQTTDANGLASFTTIYPGWYRGRAVHIHFKIRTLSASGAITRVFTSQLFMNESVTDAVFATAPYNTRNQRDTTNTTDSIYDSKLLLSPQKASGGSGYVASFSVGLTGL